ncbi:MAG: MBL fold metallo-hydrolase [Candidatus Moraniibacteriota bacterium]|nr:MAG: MBL fold metallo-hydrolase [Candidatus Moranbacteria bacterium]
MKASLKIWTFVVLLLCFVVAYLGMLIVGKSEFRAHVAFLNVGQGDAILISFGSNQLLIDTGKNGRALLSELGRQLPPWDRTIEVVLLTHPDQDHVGAFPDLVSRYRVDMLLSAELPETSAIGRAIRQTIDSHSIQRIEPRAGLSIDFAPDMHLETLFPGVNFVPNPKNTNASSIVELLYIGRDTFLFTGDLPKEESVLPARDIRVLKVAHHGSKYSTSDEFLDRMTPEEAIISVGKNSYGHPSEEVLARLASRGVHVWRTDTSGTIIYECSVLPDTSCSAPEPSF